MTENLSKYRNALSDNDVKYHSKQYNDLARELQYYHAEDCKIVGYNDIDTSQDLTQYGSLEEYAGENAIWTTSAFNRFYLAKFRQEFRKWK